MTCAAAREAILDFARDVSTPGEVRLAVEQHLAGCANCAAEFERQRDLTAALSALATEAQTWKPSPAIEGRLQEAFVAWIPVAPIPQLESKRTHHGIAALAGAAVIALAVWLGSRPSTSLSPDDGAPPSASPVTLPAVSTPSAMKETTPASSTVEANVTPDRRVSVGAGAGRRAARPKQVRSFEFMTLPGAAGLPDLESGSVVRIAVPVGALPEYGLDIVQGGSKTTVDADVLVGQDGLARAIRLVSAEESATQDTRSRR
jgi:hypothetical protein